MSGSGLAGDGGTPRSELAAWPQWSGASAGGLPALTEILRGVPRGTPAALFVVVHYPAHFQSRLSEVLNREGSLPAAQALGGAPIEVGRVYVAPPGERHLMPERGAVRLVEGPMEMRARPAADALFRAAASVYGPRVPSRAPPRRP